MSTQVVRVQEKGQVTIPFEIRKKLNLKKGDLVSFVETRSGVMIVPAEVIVSQAFEQIEKALNEKNIKLEDLLVRGRQIREGLVEDEYNPTDSQKE